jgi:hypothetical protein
MQAVVKAAYVFPRADAEPQYPSIGGLHRIHNRALS